MECASGWAVSGASSMPSPCTASMAQILREIYDKIVESVGSRRLILAIDANACLGMWFSKDTRGHFRGIAGKRDSDLKELIIVRELDVLKQPSQVFTFSGPRGQSNIDVTSAKSWRNTEWSWEVRDDCGLSDHNPIFVVANVAGALCDDEGTVCPRYVMEPSRLKTAAAYVSYQAETCGLGAYSCLAADEQ